MPQFIDYLLEGLDLEGKLNDEEMSRVILFMLAFENETFHLYLHLTNSTDNDKISAVFKRIADEKRFQVSQLIDLLGALNADKERVLHESGLPISIRG